MLIALRRTSDLFLTGQTSTHSRQPVQSSGATWSVYFSSLRPCQRAAVLLNVGGASASAAGSYTLPRMTECGQTSTHLPHWMQMVSSHTGTSWAMFRFSHFVVPTG